MTDRGAGQDTAGGAAPDDPGPGRPEPGADTPPAEPGRHAPPAEPGAEASIEPVAVDQAEPAPTSGSEAQAPNRKTSRRPGWRQVSVPQRLTPGLLAALVGALVALLAAFFTWARVTVQIAAGDRRQDLVTTAIGTDGGRLGTATLVLAIAGLLLGGLLLLPQTRPWGWLVLMGCGALVALLALVDLVSVTARFDADEIAAACGRNVTCAGARSAGSGIFLTIVGGLLMVAGAALHHLRPVPVGSALPRRRATGAASGPATGTASGPATAAASGSGATGAAPLPEPDRPGRPRYD